MMPHLSSTTPWIPLPASMFSPWAADILEPELLSFLSGYSDVKLMKADPDGAALQVKGAGKYNGSYYLFDSHPFGSKDNPLKKGIAKLSVVYPEGRTRTFYNVTCYPERLLP